MSYKYLAAALFAVTTLAQPAFAHRCVTNDKANEFAKKSATAFNQHKYADAVEAANQAIKEDDKNDCLLNNRGLAYLYNGDAAKAIADFNGALAINANDVATLNNLGLAYTVNGEVEQGIAQYNKALKIDGKDATVYRNISLSYLAKGDYDLSLANIDKAIALSSESSSYYSQRSFIYSLKGDLAKAKEDAAQAVLLSGNVITVIDRFIVQNKAGEDGTDNLKTQVQSLPQDDTDYYLLDLFLEKTTPEAAIKTAEGNIDDKCWAQYYAAQWHQWKKNNAEAAKILKEVSASQCRARVYAQAELKRLPQ